MIALSVAGCTTTEEAIRRDENRWTGRPVREFAERNVMTLTDMYNTPTGRTYMYSRAMGFGACQVAVLAVPGDGEYVVRSMSSTCPPGSF
jgi:hypothetical protein